MTTNEPPRKVAVLGGGVGAITAAFALTSTPALRARYEVTIYQQGWRLGGKGASGRNAALGQRIEEHGLHIWFGFYDNAFRLLRQCYEELGRPPDAPLATLDDAFLPHDEAVLWDHDGDGWVAWHQWAPPNPFQLGGGRELPSLGTMVATLGRWIERRWDEPACAPAGATVGAAVGAPVSAATSTTALGPAGGAPKEHRLHLPGWIEDVGRQLGHDMQHGASAFALLAHLAGGDLREAHRRSVLCHLLAALRHELWARAERHGPLDSTRRMHLGGLDLLITVLIGVLDDQLYERGFAAVDDQELIDWLRRHGAQPSTLGPGFDGRSAVIRALYDMVFAFEGGDLDRPNLAAGAAAHGLLRMAFTYKSHLYFQMRAGMGDTIFMPYYEVLRARGVRIRFFTSVQRLRLDAERQGIEGIDVVPQVALVGSDYDPAVEVEGLPCWPDQPRWEQLQDGAELAARGVNFEQQANPLGAPALTLRRGVDFDAVVLGISVGALDGICAELATDPANPAFGAMLTGATTVSTQAFQVWMREANADLGWRGGLGTISGTFTEPLDTYCDMSRLLDRESWPAAAGVASIAYFCGVQRDHDDADPARRQADADDRARQAARAFLRDDVATLWPAAVVARGQSFDWDLLADPQDRAGEERLAAQYWRGNCLGSERYVLSPAGAIRHRLPADGSGYANLFLAGDWTANGLDLGCVEAATMSGLQAARALTGEPLVITGEDHRWLCPEGSP